MDNQNKSISTVIDRDKTRRDRLQKIIQKKRQQLTRLITKVESLRVELDMVRQEYDVRVGSLYLKDSQLDVELIYFNNIIQLMDQGVSYDEAVRRLNDTYYARQHNFDKERERMKKEQKIYQERAESANKHMGDDLRKMWRNLVAKFHPDLVQDVLEKKKREDMMKQINRAYEEYNFDRLKMFEDQIAIEDYPESSAEQLESIIEEIENQMIRQDTAYDGLRKSEWYTWRDKIKLAKRQGVDIFANIERTLLNDLVKKMDRLKELKKQIPELADADQ